MNIANRRYLQKLIKEEVQRMIREAEDDAPAPNPQIEAELEKALEDAGKSFASEMNKIAKDTETKLKDEDEVQQVIDDNPELEKLAKESVSIKNRLKDGKISLQEREKLNEEIFSILGITSILMALPAVVTLIGKLVSVIERKLGGKKEMGEKIQHFGHEMHEMVLKLIQKGMMLIPGFKKMPSDKQKKIVHLVHIVIVLMLAIQSGGVAIGEIKAGLQAANIGIASFEGVLTAVKSGEVLAFLREAVMDILEA